MALHLIPDDDVPHAPTPECGCGPVLLGDRRTYAHAGTEAWDEAYRQVVYPPAPAGRPYRFDFKDTALTLAKVRAIQDRSR